MRKRSLALLTASLLLFDIGVVELVSQTDGGGVNCPSGDRYVCARSVDNDGNRHTLWKGLGPVVVVPPPER